MPLRLSGKIRVDVDELGVDLLSLSGHKVYGPNGVGALYIRKGMEKKIESIIYGGGQERSFRSGTLPVPLIVGLGEACKIANECLEEEAQRILILQGKLLAGLREVVPDLQVFGSETERIPGNLNIGFPDLSGDKIVDRVGDKLAISTGSACSSVEAKASHVLQSLNLPQGVANSGVRVSVGRFNSIEEVDIAIKWLLSVIKK